MAGSQCVSPSPSEKPDATGISALCAAAVCLRRTFRVPRCLHDLSDRFPPFRERYFWQRIPDIVRLLCCWPAMFGITTLCYRSISSRTVHGISQLRFRNNTRHAGHGVRQNEFRETTGYWGNQTFFNLYSFSK